MKILICGAGAIGSNLTSMLVPDLKGKHEVFVLDMDVVEERNVQAGTQFYQPDQIDLTKTEALEYNIYKWFNRQITPIHGKLTDGTDPLHQTDFRPENLEAYELIIDCFDNRLARNILQSWWFKGKIGKVVVPEVDNPPHLLHIGFSDEFTYAIEWAENYKVPDDITSDMDICEMEGAASFIKMVSGLGSSVVLEWVNNGTKREFVGNRFSIREIK